ncbi:hypothetical protein [Nonomuraea terrae]|nr:hypothetical protein [Nonomuraea terrae]
MDTDNPLGRFPRARREPVRPEDAPAPHVNGAPGRQRVVHQADPGSP